MNYFQKKEQIKQFKKRLKDIYNFNARLEADCRLYRYPKGSGAKNALRLKELSDNESL